MSPASLRFIGCGDAFGSGGRFQTSFLFISAGRSVLIDCGPSTLIAMRQQGIDPLDIDTILFSHLHGDHFGGLPFFLLDGRLVSKRSAPLTIIGPGGTQARIEAACEILFPGSYAKGFPFEINFIEMEFGETTEVDGLSVTPYPAIHPSGDPSQMLRVSLGGKTVTYTGDTEWTEDLITAAESADLLICECYAFEKKQRFHLDYGTLAKNTNRLNAKRRIVTHLSAEALNRREQIAWDIAEDGLEIPL